MAWASVLTASAAAGGRTIPAWCDNWSAIYRNCCPFIVSPSTYGASCAPPTSSNAASSKSAEQPAHGLLRQRAVRGPNHLFHLLEIQPGMEKPHPPHIYTGSLTSPPVKIPLTTNRSIDILRGNSINRYFTARQRPREAGCSG